MSDKYIAYVGSYTRGASEGIYILDLDPETASMSIKDTFQIQNPSFLCFSANGKYLYSSCDEGVAAFSIEPDGDLKLLGKASVNGLRPAYISVSSDNRYLVCGGYHDGKLTVLKLKKDGSVGKLSDEVFMDGLGNVGGTHYRSHVSCSIFSPDERFIFALDLGTDQVKIYELDHSSGKLTLHDILRCDLESGPRNMVFSSDGRYAYLSCEYSHEIVKYSYEPENAVFEKMQSISSVPEDFDGLNSTLTLRLTEDDRHLFVTNSGNNSVAIYNIDEGDQSMEVSCILPVSGQFPKDIALMPSGNLFASVNQEGNSITTFKVDYEKGHILMKNKPLSIPSPTCICYRKR